MEGLELLCNFVVNEMNKLNYKFDFGFFKHWFLSHDVQMIYFGNAQYAFLANATLYNM